MSRLVAFGQALIRRPLAWPESTLALARGAAAVFCNLEGCLPPPGATRMKTKTVHPAPPEALAALAALGVTHVSIANNHVWDYGHPGIVATRDAARAAGFAVAGAGRDAAEAARPAIRAGVALIAADCGPTPDWAIAGDGPGVNPLRVHRRLVLPPADVARFAAIARATGEAERAARRVAIGYDAPPGGASFYGLALVAGDGPREEHAIDPADVDRLAAAIGAARREADRALVSLHHHHWAPDWTRPPEWLDGIAARLLALGADVVAAHGPPVAHGLLTGEAGGVAALGLGNLAFHTARAERYAREGLDVFAGAALVVDGAGSRLEPVAVAR
ncbi:CapA family protein [Salinarimonas rosea]|uniref:CapA family protein n=1 Tax=Salinarimonas rosea TaxID=552063 RepID=UPI0003FF3284|nr:CapA family protein [Salinarimonas rosea]